MTNFKETAKALEIEMQQRAERAAVARERQAREQAVIARQVADLEASVPRTPAEKRARADTLESTLEVGFRAADLSSWDAVQGYYLARCQAEREIAALRREAAALEDVGDIR